MNYMKYNTLNINRKYKEIRIENMFTEEQKIWMVKEMAASRSPITVKRNIFKIFTVKGRRKKLDYQERRFREIIDHFEKYGDRKRLTPK